MRIKYNTLNEEMNRMKSLFGETRLYGNLVDKKENIVSEQYRFFRNLDSIYKVTLKSFDDLGNFTKFINREISNVDDIIKHLDEFDTLWRVVLPNVTNWTGVKNNLNRLKKLSDSGKLKNIPEDQWINKVLPGFPEKGGMRDIVNDMWRKANDKNPYLPQKVETRIVTTDPNTGALVVGTKSETGVIVYKNQKGEVVMVEKDPNIKVDDGGTNIKTDIEDVDYVDYVDVPEGTPMENLDGKKVAPTNENAEEVLNSAKKVAEGEEENVVTFTITGKGKDGIKSAEEMLDSLTNRGGGNGSVDEVVEETIEKTIEKTDIPIKDIPAYRKFLKNWYTKIFKNPFMSKWPTKFWFNPLAVGEGRMKGFSDFSIDPATGKQKYSPTDKLSQISLYAGSVSLRTLVINPVTLFTLWTTYRTLNKDRSFIEGVIEDFAVLGKAFWDWWEDVKVSSDVLDGLKRAVIQISEGKIDPDIVIDNMNKAALNAITGATTGDSFISCDDIINKTNKEIYELSFSKIKGEEKARVGEILQVGGTDPEIVTEIKKKVETLIDWVVDHNGTNKNLDNIITKTREKCNTQKEDDELNQKVIEGDYVVDLEGGVR